MNSLLRRYKVAAINFQENKTKIANITGADDAMILMLKKNCLHAHAAQTSQYSGIMLREVRKFLVAQLHTNPLTFVRLMESIITNFPTDKQSAMILASSLLENDAEEVDEDTEVEDEVEVVEMK